MRYAFFIGPYGRILLLRLRSFKLMRQAIYTTHHILPASLMVNPALTAIIGPGEGNFSPI